MQTAFIVNVYICVVYRLVRPVLLPSSLGSNAECHWPWWCSIPYKHCINREHVTCFHPVSFVYFISLYNVVM